ncbi:hypothetical protein [Halocella sp. SP3-1]|uniref:hypothetical protein n=1 Tax=Halocella sp. SP3-1 TaxID=2382161 RepID=UPI000F754B17|nr:hypothetical protein [Halocella sp. SP3-1]AZO95238.1 hypothetical protein D7D81_11925 [Halocella sp. SP3-1]
MKKLLVIGLFIILILNSAGCSSSKIINLTAEEVINAFQDWSIPIDEIEIYTTETDPNNLLGRPGQYIGKVNWSDSRIEQYGDGLKGGTIEIFDSEKELKNRKEYLEPLIEQPLFAQYMYVHNNVILRLDNELTPEQAEEYKNILESL